MFGIRNILVRIRILGSVYMNNGSGCGSCSFRQWPSRRQQNIFFSLRFYAYSFLKVHLHVHASGSIHHLCGKNSQPKRTQVLEPTVERHMPKCFWQWMEFTVIFNSKGEWKRVPWRSRKSRIIALRLTYTGLYWGVSETEPVPALRQVVHSRRDSLLAPKNWLLSSIWPESCVSL